MVADAAPSGVWSPTWSPRPAAAPRFLINVEVDIVPCGGTEREDRTIVWPERSVMNTLAFAESLDTALE